jgi:Rrf2 family protein
MRLSTRSKYGLRALMDMAAHSDENATRLKDLAKRNNIPVKFLEQIFLALRNSGVVHSQVGAHGGYTLARPAAQITLGEVIRVLDGTIAPVSCTSQIAYEKCSCPDERTCPLRVSMNQVRDAIVAVVDNTTLADAVLKVKPSARRANNKG